ncbi:hypothetical protein EJB05_15289, partial [Eragrostis curvula]
MLKKKAPGAAAAAEPASPTGLGDPQSPSPPASKFARHSNGGGPPSLLLSTRSLPSLFSTDCPISPTSMTDQPKNPPCFSPKNGIRSEATGLAGVLVAGEADGGYLKNGRVLLGMRLRVQLPPPPVGKVGPGDLPGSPIEFGVKNRDAQLALLSPVQRSPLSSAARAARRSEVGELAEDYTCVIARGPNPKMTHIFEDRVVESRAGAGAGDGDGDACCLLSTCCGCKEDALLLPRDKEGILQQPVQLRCFLVKGYAIPSDSSVELKP